VRALGGEPGYEVDDPDEEILEMAGSPWVAWRAAVPGVVLYVIATVEEVIEDLGDRGLFDQAEDLARVRGHLLSRLQR